MNKWWMVAVAPALGAAPALRLGADLQIFFESGSNIKTLRLTAGITF